MSFFLNVLICTLKRNVCAFPSVHIVSYCTESLQNNNNKQTKTNTPPPQKKNNKQTKKKQQNKNNPKQTTTQTKRKNRLKWKTNFKSYHADGPVSGRKPNKYQTTTFRRVTSLCTKAGRILSPPIPIASKACILRACGSAYNLKCPHPQKETWKNVNKRHVFLTFDRLTGLAVWCSPPRAQSRVCCGSFFSGPVIPVATLSGAWRYRVSPGISFSVSVL